MCGSLILYLTVGDLGQVKGISDTKSVKRVCLLSQQRDVEFARSVDNLQTSGNIGGYFLTVELKKVSQV